MPNGRCLSITLLRYEQEIILNYLQISVSFRQSNGQYYGQDVIAIQRQLCDIPQTLQGEWFSREDGENVYTVITSDSLSNRGRCLHMHSTNYDNFTLVLQQGYSLKLSFSKTLSESNLNLLFRSCYHCVRLIIRTLNVLEKIESKLFYSFF